MDILAIILACSLHPDDALVRTMIDVQSGGNPLFVGDLATLKTVDNLTSVDDALRTASEIARHGGRPAVGLLGLPLEWAARFSRQPRELFDACTNVEMGTAMLAEYWGQCTRGAQGRRMARHRRRSSIAGARTCVLTIFAQDLGLQATPSELLKVLEVSVAASVSPPSDKSAVFPDGSADGATAGDWSNPSLFLKTQPTNQGGVAQAKVRAGGSQSSAQRDAGGTARPATARAP